MSTSQLQHKEPAAAPENSARMPAVIAPFALERVPTPLERTFALVLADRDRRNLLGRWLTLLGVTSCRTALDSTPLTSLTPMSTNELVVTEASPEEVETQVISLRTRGWKNIVVAVPNAAAETAAAALRSDVRVMMRRSQGAPMVNLPDDVEQAATPGAEKRHEQQTEAKLLASQLTSRERVVLQLVARGHSNREIGDYLKLSPLTIKSHMSRISRKFGTGDRSRMVLIGMRGGAIS